MKLLKSITAPISAIALCLAPEILHAQTPSAQPPDTPYTVSSRDAHTTTWEKTTYELSPSGEWVPHVHGYVETATGLNFFNPATGQFEPSSTPSRLPAIWRRQTLWTFKCLTGRRFALGCLD